MTKQELEAANDQFVDSLEDVRRRLQHVLAVVEGALASEREEDSDEEE